MASESGLVGYVALSLADLQAFDHAGELRPGVFCAPGVKGKYVPLDPTMESAIETAVTQWFSASFLVAECDTKWDLVKLSFSNVTIASMFQAKELSWGVNMIRLRLWTSVNAKWCLKKCPDSLPKAELIEVPLSQVSMEDWGDRVLHWKLQVRASCQQCSQADRSVWKATGGGHYCAECWHAHGKRKVCGSLHALYLTRHSIILRRLGARPARFQMGQRLPLPCGRLRHRRSSSLHVLWGPRGLACCDRAGSTRSAGVCFASSAAVSPAW